MTHCTSHATAVLSDPAACEDAAEAPDLAHSVIRSGMGGALDAFEAAGNMDLAEYMRRLDPGRTMPPVQDGGDLVGMVTAEMRRLGMPQLAEAMRRELEERFHALTANHHGLDFHPEFAQGNLLFALRCRHAVPVFSCGGVPGNNTAYPRGILLARSHKGDWAHFVRVPVLPDRHRHVPVSVRKPFGLQSVAGPERLKGCSLSSLEHMAVQAMVQNLYHDPRVVAMRSFRDQASFMNARLWNMVTAESGLPPLVSLDMQWLSSRLLAADALAETSLAHAVFFTPSLLQRLFHELNGVRGCWTVAAADGERLRGSFLFWGIAADGRLVPLLPDPRFLVLVPAFEACFDAVPLTPQHLSAALKNGRLLPSLFSMFLATALARGLFCAGGIFQCEYLPRMALGLARVLADGGEAALAGRVQAVSPPVTGLLPLRWSRGDPAHGLFAAGPMEWFAAGGLTERTVEELRAARVMDALRVSLPYHFDDLDLAHAKHIVPHAAHAARRVLIADAIAAAGRLPCIEPCTGWHRMAADA